MKDYYTLKEVLLGLRNEQLRIANMLEKLNSKLVIDGNQRYKKSGFVFLDNNLMYSLKEKNTMLQNIIYALTLRFKEIVLGDCSYESIRILGNGDYKISGISGIKASVKEKEQVSFNKLIDEILNDDFVKCSNIRINGKTLRDYHNRLSISPIKTKYTGSLIGSIGIISYQAKSDEIAIVSDKKIGKNEKYTDIIKNLLETRFLRSDFPEYIQNVIDNSIEVEKEVVVMDTKTHKKTTTFSVDDKPNGIVLVKKNK